MEFFLIQIEPTRCAEVFPLRGIMPPPQQNNTDKKKVPVQETAPPRKPKQAPKKDVESIQIYLPRKYPNTAQGNLDLEIDEILGIPISFGLCDHCGKKDCPC